MRYNPARRNTAYRSIESVLMFPYNAKNWKGLYRACAGSAPTQFLYSGKNEPK